jgi:hypothetical protein
MLHTVKKLNTLNNSSLMHFSFISHSFQFDFGNCGLTFNKIRLDGYAHSYSPTVLDLAYKYTYLEVKSLG